MADTRRGQVFPQRRSPMWLLAAVCTAGALFLAGCSAPDGSTAPTSQSGEQQAADRVILKSGGARAQLVSGTDAEAALASSRTLFEASPLAIVAPPDDAAAVEQAADEAVRLGVPVLLAGDGLLDELERLRVGTVKAFGEPGDSTTADPGPGASAAASVPASSASAPGDGGAPSSQARPGWRDLLTGLEVLGPEDAVERPEREPAAAPYSVLLAPEAAGELPAAVAVARAAGSRVHEDPAADPRVDPGTIDFLRAAPENSVLGLGDGFGSAEVFAERTDAALTVPELPGGGLLAFPGRRMVALYGNPSGPALGALGEQDVDAAIQRAKDLAQEYQPYSDEPVQPAFEIIATVATSSAGDDGDYSSTTDPEELRTWVDAAGEAGVYVVLDLQPGTTDFLTQARHFEELLKLPHVGLALDPEWRLQDGQRHLEQIGSVDAAEVNRVADWLAGLTRAHNLPQKVFLLHQFQLRMIGNRESLDTAHEELAVVVHADGHGGPEQKMETWRTLRQDLPEDVWMGWKNFYDEDTPMFSPERTYREVSPAPWFVSYQ